MAPTDRSLDAFTDGPSAADPEPSAADEQSDSVSASDSDEYGTPRRLIRRFHEAIGGRFGLDPAAGAEPIPIAETRLTKADDGLAHDWRPYDSIYLNPPYSNPDPWLEQLATTFATTASEAPRFALALTRADTSTEWFHQYLLEGAVYCFPDSRIKFHGGDDSPDFASLFTVFGEPPAALLEVLAGEGALFSHVEVATALEQQRLDDLISDGGLALAPIPAAQQPTPGSDADTGDELAVVRAGDRLRLTFDETGLGAPTVPSPVTVTVLPDGKQVAPETGAVTIDTVGTGPDGTQVCVALRTSSGFASRLEASIAVDTDHWTLATPETIALIDAGSQPAGFAPAASSTSRLAPPG